MHDPNTIRHHYTLVSRNLARQRRLNHALQWLCLWLILSIAAIVAVMA